MPAWLAGVDQQLAAFEPVELRAQVISSWAAERQVQTEEEAAALPEDQLPFRWSRPPTGPLPDKYLILSGGKLAGSVAGTATSYRQAGLTPASSYQYRVVAARGGKRSPQSAILPVSTITPPISQARRHCCVMPSSCTVRSGNSNPPLVIR